MPPSRHLCQFGTSSLWPEVIIFPAASHLPVLLPPTALSLLSHAICSSSCCLSHRTMVTTRAFALDVSQPGAAAMALDQDWHALGDALSTLGGHLADSVDFDLSIGGILRIIAVVAAIYLLVLDKTNWRTNLMTVVLVPYLALQLPEPFFGWLRGGIGTWIAFVAVVIRLFFAEKFPELIHGGLEIPVAFILLIVTAPNMIVHARGHTIAEAVCLVIGAYLLIQHTSHAGGFRRAFAQTDGLLHTIGILVLFVAPLYTIITSWI